MEWWESRPEWLRWILYYPAIIIVAWSIAIFLNIFSPTFYLFQYVQHFIIAGILLFLSYKLAPRWKNGLLIAMAILMTISNIRVFVGDNVRNISTGAAIVSILSTVLFTIVILKEK